MNGSISLIRLDIVDLAAVHTLSPLYCIGDAMATGVVIANHTAGHTKLLRTNDFIIVGNDTGTGRHIYPVGNAAKLIENQRIEHMDTLRDDDRIGISLHLGIAAGIAGLEIIPRDIHLFSVH